MVEVRLIQNVSYNIQQQLLALRDVGPGPIEMLLDGVLLDDRAQLALSGYQEIDARQTLMHPSTAVICYLRPSVQIVSNTGDPKTFRHFDETLFLDYQVACICNLS